MRIRLIQKCIRIIIVKILRRVWRTIIQDSNNNNNT